MEIVINDYYNNIILINTVIITISCVQSCVVVMSRNERESCCVRKSVLLIASRLGLFALARFFPARQRLRVIVHYRPGGYELGAVRQNDLAARGRRARPHFAVVVGPRPARRRGRQTAGRRRERVRHAIRGQHGRATVATTVHAPTEAAAATADVLLVMRRRVRGVVTTGRRLDHMRPVTGHRDAAADRLRVGRGPGRRVLGAVRRAAGAHDGRAPGSRGGYAAGSGNGHAAAPHHQPLDLRPRVAVVLGGRLVRGPVVHLGRFRGRGRVLLRLERPHVAQHALFHFRGVTGRGRVPARPFQRFRSAGQSGRARATNHVQSVRFRFVAVAAVPANVRGRPVLDDLGKRVHHRLQRVLDQYREVIGPRRRPVDPAQVGRRVARVPVQPIRVAAAHATAALQWRREHRAPDDLAPDGHLFDVVILVVVVVDVVVVVVVVITVVVTVTTDHRLVLGLQVLNHLAGVRRIVRRPFPAAGRVRVVVLVLLQISVQQVSERLQLFSAYRVGRGRFSRRVRGHSQVRQRLQSVQHVFRGRRFRLAFR